MAQLPLSAQHSEPYGKPVQANTYCMNRPTRMGGLLCHNSIPIGETLCADCKTQAKPTQGRLCAVKEANAN
jgi:hypothetical protein